MHEKTPHINLVGPIFLIGIGSILLLNNIGILNWTFWDIARLWPILLIAAGLEVLVGRRSILGAIVAAGLVLLLLAGGVWLIGFSAHTPGEIVTIKEPLGDFGAATVHLRPGMGQLYVSALDDSDDFVAGSVVVQRQDDLEPRLTLVDGRADFALERDQAWVIPFAPQRDHAAHVWNLSFHPNVALDLVAEIGAGELDLALNDLKLDNVEVSFGMGKAAITLPDTPGLNVDISGAIGEIVISVPVGAAARIHAEGALVNRQVPGNYSQTDNVYRSPGYAEALDPMEINVSLAIGEITVRETRDIP